MAFLRLTHLRASGEATERLLVHSREAVQCFSDHLEMAFHLCLHAEIGGVLLKRHVADKLDDRKTRKMTSPSREPVLQCISVMEEDAPRALNRLGRSTGCEIRPSALR